MYEWVSHTHCHLGGECPHHCSYCYVDHFPFGRPKKYQGELRLIEKELSVNYGSGKTIFVENCNDLFAEEVPQEFVHRVMRHCKEYPDNIYVFQTKNPARAFYVGKIRWPENSILGCTIETNRQMHEISNAPDPDDRMYWMSMIEGRKFITIEPIMDFDVDILASWIGRIRPEFVNIGADSKGHNLPEPTPEKVHALIAELNEYGIEIREKHNLERLFSAPTTIR
jgi:DNA repair photolyase